MLKKIIALVLSVLMLLSLVACGGGGNAETTAPKSNDAPPAEGDKQPDAGSEDITLSYIWWGNQIRAERTTKVTEMFTEANPNIKFALEYFDGGSYFEVLTTRSVGEMLPNVLQMEWDYTPLYAGNGTIISMEPYIEKGIIDLSKCDPNTVDAGRVNGEVYALSLGNNARCLFYNADLLEELGLSISMEPTWEEFCELGKTIYEKTGIKTSFCWQISVAEMPRSLARAAGYELYNEDGTALGFDDPEILARGYDLLAEAGKAEWVVDPAEYSGVTGTEHEFLALGTAWNAFLTSNMGVALASAMSEDVSLGICMQPSFADRVRQPWYVQPSQLISMGNAGTEAEKEASAAYINYMINSVDANLVLLNERGVSMNSEVCAGMESSLDDVSKLIANYVTYVAENGSPAPNLDPSAAREIGELDKNLRQMVLFGQMTGAEAAAEFMAQANAILAG